MANLKNTEKKTKSQAMGMHTEVLTGRTQQKFFNPDEAENFYYFGTYDVDFNKRTDLDVLNMSAPEANKEIDKLISRKEELMKVSYTLNNKADILSIEFFRELCKRPLEYSLLNL